METEKVYQAIVVGDGDNLTRAFKECVERLPFTVMSVSSTQSAIKAFQTQSARLIVIGSTVSPDDASLFIESLRARKEGAYLTVLLVACQADSADLKRIVDAGVDLFWNGELDNAEFTIWLTLVEKRICDVLEKEKNDQKIINYKNEQDDFNNQLEDAITRANQMAREAEQAYIEINQIFKTIAGGIVLIDANFKLLRCNDTFLTMINRSSDEALGAQCSELFNNELCSTAKTALQQIKNGEKRVENELEISSGDETIVYYHIISTPFRGPVGELIGIVEHVTDVTARVKAEMALKESEHRYKELSTVDELTQLYNKRYFSKSFGQEIARSKRYGQPLSLLLMDIDNFKIHNDTYGHADGDRVLKQLGAVVRNSIRSTDIGCRYGGEEFTVILPETDREGAITVAERIRKEFAGLEFRPAPHVVVQKTVSVGIAQLSESDSEESFLERTDQNMYKAKNSGKNKFVFA